MKFANFECLDGCLQLGVGSQAIKLLWKMLLWSIYSQTILLTLTQLAIALSNTIYISQFLAFIEVG